jgi:pre-60S factor REI1
VTFLDVEHQREHHKSEWHKYNLKRKVVELPPVTQDVFYQIEANNIKMIDNTEDGDDCESFGSVDEDQPSGVAIPSNECLFCNMKSTNLEDNLMHMSLSHSFFIPDIEFVTDLEGLVSYLGEKVGLGFECLWCSENGKQFRSALSAKQHRRVKDIPRYATNQEKHF